MIYITIAVLILVLDNMLTNCEIDEVHEMEKFNDKN